MAVIRTPKGQQKGNELQIVTTLEPDQIVQPWDQFNERLLQSEDALNNRLAQTEAIQADILVLLRALSVSQPSAPATPATLATPATATFATTTPATIATPTTTTTTTTTSTASTTVAPTTSPVSAPLSTTTPFCLPVQELPPMRGTWNLPLDKVNFLNWKAQFLVRAISSEVGALFDHTTGDFVLQTSDTPRNVRLNARLMECLGTTNSFAQNTELLGDGLELWQIVVASYGPAPSYQHSSAQLATFWTSFSRNPNEGVDDYFNRYMALVRLLPVSTQNDANLVRRRFLETLGGEFSRFVADSKDNILEIKYLTWSWKELLFDLRACSMAHKKDTSAALLTSSAFGFSAHAAIAAPTDVDTKYKALEDKIKALEAATSKAEKNASAARKKKTADLQASPDTYCHTHGYSKGTHTSLTCKNKGPGHNDFAVLTDTMGGSTTRWTPWSPQK